LTLSVDADKEQAVPTRPRVVFVSHYAPLVLAAGADIRTHRLLTGLSAEFDVTFVTFEPAGVDGRTVAPSELAAAFPEISLVTAPPPRQRNKRAAQALTIAGHSSYTWGRWATPAFRFVLRDAVKRVNPAIVHFNDLAVALAGPVEAGLNVYSSQNVEHRVIRGAAEMTQGARKLFALIEAPKTRLEEKRVWQAMDVCLAVSELDAATIRAGGSRRVEVCLVGTDPVRLYPPPRRAADDPFRLVFVGSSYHPNEHGIAWFIERVLPAVRTAVPTVLEVVGMKPSRTLDAPGVVCTGQVPSVEPHYERAHAAIVPIFYGSGVRGKVVEAMAYGRPVVSTALGVEGLPVGPGMHYLRADDEDTFARALIELAERLRSPAGDLIAMLRAARTLAERHFWPSVVADLVALYRRETDARGL
jgi:glycosyltransferase involved in cell wall biosynthesis